MKYRFQNDETNSEDSIFDERLDLYEAYWVYVDGVRYVGSVLRHSEATKEDTDISPLARHFQHLYDKKEELKKQCRSLDGTLPEYKEHFKKPTGNVRKIPRSEIEDLNIKWTEGDDPIWLPREYELPSVWDGTDDLDPESLQQEVRQLRKQNKQLRKEKDSLRHHLSEIQQSISTLLNAETEIDPDRKRSNVSESTEKTLRELAESVPETQLEKEATPTIDGDGLEEDLDNLNHLLKGTL